MHHIFTARTGSFIFIGCVYFGTSCAQGNVCLSVYKSIPWTR